MLLICCLLLLPRWESVIFLCFVVRYFISIQVHVLQSFWWGRESWLLCLVFFLVSRDCCVALLRGTMCLSSVWDCGFSWSYSLTINIYMIYGARTAVKSCQDDWPMSMIYNNAERLSKRFKPQRYCLGRSSVTKFEVCLCNLSTYMRKWCSIELPWCETACASDYLSMRHNLSNRFGTNMFIKHFQYGGASHVRQSQLLWDICC